MPPLWSSEHDIPYSPWPRGAIGIDNPILRVDARALERYITADTTRGLQGRRLAAIDEFLAPMVYHRLTNEDPKDAHYYREVFMANHPNNGEDMPSAEELEPLLRTARSWIAWAREILEFQGGRWDEENLPALLDYMRLRLSREIWNEVLPYLGLQDGWSDVNITRIISTYVRWPFIEGRATWSGLVVDDDAFNALNAAIATAFNDGGGGWHPGANQGEENGQHSVLDVAVRCEIPEEDPECSICREDLTEETEHYPVRTGCEHIFGGDCLQNWLSGFPQGQATCPMCRGTLRLVAAEPPDELLATEVLNVGAVDTMAEARQLVEETQHSMSRFTTFLLTASPADLEAHADGVRAALEALEESYDSRDEDN
ncbi:hypothetical protein BU16DRAFT_566723 [Lophium mytilinum]|uniref:RING-type domain-containing protein n=1 Tax=Lophium mytilinum TaxID=390894 RepID=A0A6A6QC34_9PEZI|nr:hypothetical protein BU16DRAFT_566723 [Lophium mytilinum]